MLGFVLTGTARPANWASTIRTYDVADGKGLVELLAHRLGEARVTWERVEPRPGVEHPGRIAAGLAHPPDASGPDGIPLGRVGEIHPELLEAYDIRAPHVVFGEVPLTALASLVPERVVTGDLDAPPPVERDLAFVVAADVAAGTVGELIRSAAGPALLSIALFDRYQGPPLSADEVSLAWRLRFEPDRDDPDGRAIDDRMGRVASVLSERIGARLRG
jgi:phenylalanyl-tRNA synthetase beta chain